MVFLSVKNNQWSLLILECVERRNEKSCKAKIKTLDNEIVDRLHNHTHPTCPERIQLNALRKSIKDRAKRSTEKTRNVISEEVTAVQDALFNFLPSVRTIQGDVQRQRQLNQNQLQVPAVDDIAFEIPDEFLLFIIKYSISEEFSS